MMCSAGASSSSAPMCETSSRSSSGLRPGSERLTLAALLQVRRDHAGDVVVEAPAGDLVGPQLATEVGAEREGTAEVYLEALDLVAVVVEHELALEADVGDLGACAG